MSNIRSITDLADILIETDQDDFEDAYEPDFEQSPRSNHETGSTYHTHNDTTMLYQNETFYSETDNVINSPAGESSKLFQYMTGNNDNVDIEEMNEPIISSAAVDKELTTEKNSAVSSYDSFDALASPTDTKVDLNLSPDGESEAVNTMPTIFQILQQPTITNKQIMDTANIVKPPKMYHVPPQAVNTKVPYFSTVKSVKTITERQAVVQTMCTREVAEGAASAIQTKSNLTEEDVIRIVETVISVKSGDGISTKSGARILKEKNERDNHAGVEDFIGQLMKKSTFVQSLTPMAQIPHKNSLFGSHPRVPSRPSGTVFHGASIDL